MSYSGKVVFGESVDKLLLQAQIDSFDQIVQENWKEYSDFFKGLETRLKNSINKWCSKFFEEWEVTKITWPIGIEEDNEGKWFVSANECHANFFEFKFVNYETHVGFVLKFKDLSLEHGLEAFQNLEFEQLIFEIWVSYMDDETSFDQALYHAKIAGFIEFLKKNFDYFKQYLQDCARESELKSRAYNNDVEAITARLHSAIDSLKFLEKKEQIQRFFNALSNTVTYDEPKTLRLSTKHSIIAKSMKIERVHANRKFVDIEVEELELSRELGFSKKKYERVFIKTLFGFDLTNSETLKLIGNDF